MTTVERWSGVAPSDRASWRAAFVACAASLRGDRARAHTPSAAYTDLVLRVAEGRPSQLLLARDGDVTGRALVAAHLGSGRSAAAFGLVELAAGDAGAAAAHALVDAACAWARERGLDELIGPLDVSTWFTHRFLVPPQPGDTTPPPFAWEPAQPDEYRQIFSALGFEPLEHYHTIGGDLSEVTRTDAATVLTATEMALEQARATGFSFHRLETAGGLAPILGELHALCMDAFRDNLLFEPLPLEPFLILYGGAANGRDTTLTHWVRDVTGRLAGFVLAFVDGDTAVVKTIAVAPQLRGKRISSALVHLVLEESVSRGIPKVVSALVRRGNTSERLSSPYLRMDVKPWTREYVLMRRAVADAAR